MAELKTVPTRASVDKFLRGISDERKRTDCYKILEVMKKATRAEPRMWGTSIVGFGRSHLTYESGREIDWFLAGFSPRKQNISLYLMCGLDQIDDLIQQLGKCSTSKSCLYINRLEDVDMKVLKKLISRSLKLASQANGNPGR